MLYEVYYIIIPNIVIGTFAVFLLYFGKGKKKARNKYQQLMGININGINQANIIIMSI